MLPTQIDLDNAVVAGVGNVHVGSRDRHRLRIDELRRRADDGIFPACAECGHRPGRGVVADDAVVVRVGDPDDPVGRDGDALDVIEDTDRRVTGHHRKRRRGEARRVLLETVVARVANPHVAVRRNSHGLRPRVVAGGGAALALERDVGAGGAELLDTLVEPVNRVGQAAWARRRCRTPRRIRVREPDCRRSRSSRSWIPTGTR